MINSTVNQDQQTWTIISVIILQRCGPSVSRRACAIRAFLCRQLHAQSLTALWLDSDVCCPPSALQNNRTRFDEGVLKRRRRKKIYSRRLDEKVRQQIHSVSSGVVTMHIEEAWFQTSRSADFKMNVEELRQTPCAPPRLLLPVSFGVD